VIELMPSPLDVKAINGFDEDEKEVVRKADDGEKKKKGGLASRVIEEERRGSFPFSPTLSSRFAFPLFFISSALTFHDFFFEARERE